MKKIAISQSNYIPWKGYFDMINTVDVFVIYDDMQYTKRDWRNRNIIKTIDGEKWLTVPVEVKGKYHQKINETKISETSWSKAHWETIKQSYSKSQYFKEYCDLFEPFYQNPEIKFLSELNVLFIKKINEILKINTKIIDSRELQLRGDKSEKLLNICKDLGASRYYSGPAAKDYLDTDLFSKSQVEVEWMDYSGYPEYKQLHGDFNHYVSIIDLIFNMGPNSIKFMKSF